MTCSELKMLSSPSGSASRTFFKPEPIQLPACKRNCFLQSLTKKKKSPSSAPAVRTQEVSRWPRLSMLRSDVRGSAFGRAYGLSDKYSHPPSSPAQLLQALCCNFCLRCSLISHVHVTMYTSLLAMEKTAIIKHRGNWIHPLEGRMKRIMEALCDSEWNSRSISSNYHVPEHNEHVYICL